MRKTPYLFYYTSSSIYSHFSLYPNLQFWVFYTQLFVSNNLSALSWARKNYSPQKWILSNFLLGNKKYPTLLSLQIFNRRTSDTLQKKQFPLKTRCPLHYKCLLLSESGIHRCFRRRVFQKFQERWTFEGKYLPWCPLYKETALQQILLFEIFSKLLEQLFYRKHVHSSPNYSKHLQK